jgi:hypothetical protein
MNINIKEESDIVVTDHGRICDVICGGICRCYVVIESKLHVLECGKSVSTSSSSLKMVTDSIEDVMLYHLDALQSFQRVYKDKMDALAMKAEIDEKIARGEESEISELDLPEPIEPQVGE